MAGEDPGAEPASLGAGPAGLAQDPMDGARPQVEQPRSYAGLVTRAIAIALDALVIDGIALAVTGAVLLLSSIFSISNRHHDLAVVVGAALFILWVVCYFGSFWTTTGQTPGNRVMQIRVTRTDGTRLRPRHALVRIAGMILSLPLFWGYLPILTNKRRRGVFDVMAGTVVTNVAAASPAPATPAPRISSAARELPGREADGSPSSHSHLRGHAAGIDRVD